MIYEQNDGLQVGNYSELEERLFVKVLKRSNQNFDSNPEYWKLEARNIYKIGDNIDNAGFMINIFDDTASDGSQTLICPSDIGAGYAETYNDYMRLDTNDDGIINEEDQTLSLDTGFLTFAFLKPFSALGDSLVYEKDPTIILPDDIIMNNYLRAKLVSEMGSLTGLQYGSVN